MHCKRRKTVSPVCAVARCLAACLAASAALAAEPVEQLQSHASIRASAERHALAAAEALAGRPQVEVGRLDSRLRLHACDQALSTYDSPNGLSGGRGVVGVRCEGSKPWKIYVPVQIALLEQVVVSRRPVVRGHTLSVDDVALAETDTATLHRAYFTAVDEVIGLRSTRAIPGGSTLHAGMLRRAKLVRRGAQVEIVALTDGLSVRMRGKALADGGRGDRIRVKNLNSGRVITGTVTGAGRIEVLH